VRFDGLWRHRDFLRLWSAQTISVFGTMISGSALPFTAILALDASALQVAVLTACRMLPGLLIGAHVGVWVDRLMRRPVMIVADIGRAALVVSVPLAYVFDVLTMEQLYVVAFGMGALTMVFDVAYQSYLPSLVSKEDLLEGNSKLTGSSSVSEFAGFSVSGWLVQAITGPGAMLVDALSFVASAAFLRDIEREEPPPIPAREQTSVREEALDGLRSVWRDGVLRALGGATALYSFGFGIFLATYLLFVTRGLGFEPGVLGLIFGLGGLSSLAGAMLAGRAAARFGAGPAMTAGLAAMGLSMLLIPAAPGATVVGAALLIAQQLGGDGGFVVHEVNAVSLRQSIVEERMLGRVNAFMRILEVGLLLAGTIVGGVLAEIIGLRAALTIGGAATVAAALWLFASPARRARMPSTITPVEPLAATAP
jgi:MFS family permease